MRPPGIFLQQKAGQPACRQNDTGIISRLMKKHQFIDLCQASENREHPAAILSDSLKLFHLSMRMHYMVR
jgi:hypothetical protein